VRLEVVPGADEGAAAARTRAGAEARQRFGGANLVDFAVVASVRRLFREAGTDPTRYRPSSEALLRRILKGEELPAIHPLVDLNNCLSVALAVPSCVMAEGSVEGRIELRRGLMGERMESLRGDFDLAGKPLLADARGPFGTPITDSRRVAVGEATRAAWLVAYLPATGEEAATGVLPRPSAVAESLERFGSGVAQCSEIFVSGEDIPAAAS
jgi:DNA/RNA-binding domain of Phe-tRNA-synthetase-like protein